MTFKKGFERALDWFFPRRCPICDKTLPPENYICDNCKPKLRYIQGPVCFRCGKKIKQEEEEFCFDCKRKKHAYKQGAALYEYGAIHSSIYRFKYGKRAEYATFFGKELAEHLKERIMDWQVDGVVPVPMYPGKEQKRGYNQAKELAKAFAKEQNLMCYENLICREKDTVPMKNLDVRERQINLKNAFKIRQFDVKLKGVIVVDDIYTTGSTIDSMALELKKVGIQNIYFIALAIGEGM